MVRDYKRVLTFTLLVHVLFSLLPVMKKNLFWRLVEPSLSYVLSLVSI